MDPVRGEFLVQLQELANQKQGILSQSELSDEAKAQKIAELRLDYQGAQMALEDLCLTFQVMVEKRKESIVLCGV